MPTPRLSIIIISYNTAELTKRTLETVLRDARQSDLLSSLEILIVDNASNDDSVAQLRQFLRKSSLIPKQWRLWAETANLGFGKANNLAVSQARGDFVFLLNSDTEVELGTLATLLACLEHKGEKRLVAAQLLNEDGSLQHQGGDEFGLLSLLGQWWWLARLPGLGRYLPSLQGARVWRRLQSQMRLRSGRSEGRSETLSSSQLIEQGWVGATALMLSRRFYLDLGGFDTARFMYGEDLDLSWRARAQGGRVGICPQARVLHLGSQSGSRHYARLEEARSLFYLWQKYWPRRPLWPLRFIISLGALARALAYLLLARLDFARTYLQIVALAWFY